MDEGQILARAIAIEPVDFASARGEDATQHNGLERLRMGLRIGERQRRAP